MQAAELSQRAQVVAGSEPGGVKGVFRQIADPGSAQVAPVDLPCLGEDKAHDQLQEGGLAGAVWPQEAENGPGRDLKGQPVEGER